MTQAEFDKFILPITHRVEANLQAALNTEGVENAYATIRALEAKACIDAVLRGLSPEERKEAFAMGIDMRTSENLLVQFASVGKTES